MIDRKPTRAAVVRELRYREKVAFDEDSGHAADLIEKQAARIAELEAQASIELTQSQNHGHVRKLARLHPIASEETADLARPLPDKP